MNFFNYNIKFIREKRGESQAQFAQALGLSRSNIASYEGKSEPPYEVLTQIVNGLDIKLSMLLTVQMTHLNYESFYNSHDNLNIVSEPEAKYGADSPGAQIIGMVQLLAGDSISKSEKAELVSEIGKHVAMLSDKLLSAKQAESDAKSELVEVLMEMKDTMTKIASGDL